MSIYNFLKNNIVRLIILSITISILQSCDSDVNDLIFTNSPDTIFVGIAEKSASAFEDGGEIRIPLSLSNTLKESATIVINITEGVPLTYGVDYRTLPEASSGEIIVSLDAGTSLPEVKIIPLLTTNVLDYTLSFHLGNVQGGVIATENSGTFTATIEDQTKNVEIIAFTSFEEPTAGTVNNYTAIDGVDQPNFPGLNSVDYMSNGGEMGFDFSYIPGQEGGADSSLYWGVTNVLNEPGEWSLPFFAEGNQAYVASDADGLAEIVFDEIQIPSNPELLLVRLSTHFADSSWETSDEFDIFWRTEDGDELILSFRGDGNGDMTDSPDGSGNIIEGDWFTFTAFIQNKKTGSLVIQIGNNSGSEIVFLDDIRIGIKI